MAVVREFRLPDLGEGLTEATIVRWLVSPGDHVAVDQTVVEVETAKALVDVPCPYAGVVTARFGEEGEEVPVGSPLVTVAVGPPADARPPAEPGGSADPQPSSSSSSAQPPAGGTAPSASPSPETSGNVLVGYGTGAPAARRRRVRPSAAPSVPPAPGRNGSAGPGAGPNGAAEGPVPVISPLVRRLAREHDLDLRTVTGSGPDGLILRGDVERALATPAPPTPSASPSPSFPADAVRVPLTGLRRTVADKLSRSRREIPDATCWVDADATELLAARAAMNAGGAPKVSLLAVLARITVAALARHPELNSAVDEENRQIVHLPAVHLGFAAQTDRGLVVPVVRDAHRMTTAALSAEITRLTAAAREGRLTPAELTGGTFTLNNYGVFGVDGSTPIINHPEAAMLGVGRIAPKPWVHEGELAVRHVTQLSLTFDHRVCDGGTAGGFLRFVADCVEHPAVLLRNV